MRYVSALVCCVVALASLAGPAHAQGPQAAEPVVRVTLRSAVLGEERDVLIRVPAGYSANEQRYPVLYMTDGAAHIAHTSATLEFLSRNQRMPEMIVVAITNTDRTRDLTPPPAKADAARFPTAGGADNFLRFIETELIPHVESTYRTHPYRVFAGHSFGGLLAVHAFGTKPELFNAYISVSPSLWWDGEAPARRVEELFKQRKELNRALYVTLGNEPGNMLEAYNRFVKLLEKRAPSGLEWAQRRMDDEDHGSVVLRSHYQGLRHVFSDWLFQVDPQSGTIAGGLRGADEHYGKLSKKYGYTVPVPEALVNLLGYQQLQAGKTNEAIEIFKTNVERYPGSANVYDSLAEAYEKSGKLELARENYARAVTIGTERGDANLAIYKQNLARVEGQLASQ